MIIFRCPNCKKKFGVPDNFADQSVHCNQCGRQMVVPRPPAAASKTQQAEIRLQPPMQFDKPAIVHTEDSHSAAIDSDELCLAPLPPQPDSDSVDASPQLKPRTLEESPSPSGWYWPFLFPLNGTGLGMIGLFVLSRLILWLGMVGAAALLGVIGLALAVILAVISFLIQIYACSYTCLCVQASSQGQIKAPDTLQHDMGGLWEMIKQVLRIIAALGFCAMPAIFYYYHYKNQDYLFWTIAAAGWFFLPMMMLSSIMYDSLAGLNPFLVLFSAFRLFFRYVLLVLALTIPAGLFICIFIYSKILGMLVTLPAQAVLLYLAFVGAAMLGRFFKVNEERLGWNI
jgi:DNA-directed RNA polymerase subunit RPC12/RpoP